MIRRRWAVERWQIPIPPVQSEERPRETDVSSCDRSPFDAGGFDGGKDIAAVARFLPQRDAIVGDAAQMRDGGTEYRLPGPPLIPHRAAFAEMGLPFAGVARLEVDTALGANPAFQADRLLVHSRVGALGGIIVR